MKNLKRFLNVIIGEVFLGFLALVAAALTVIPLLFSVSDKTNNMLEAGQWAIVALFAVEYVVSLMSAASAKRFVLNPWRVVDAATIVIPMVTFLPGASDLLRSSPVLRLVRLARVVALGARASGVVTRQDDSVAAVEDKAEIKLRVLQEDGKAPRAATWDEFARWSKQPQTGWYSIANVGPHNLAEVAKASGIDEEFLATHMLDASYPHIETTDRHFSMFVWVPRIVDGKHVERNAMLLLAGNETVITFSRRPIKLMEMVASQRVASPDDASFGARIVCQFIKTVLDANDTLVGRFEDELRDMEEIPVRESRPQFFERAFRLKKELSAAQADLWRLRGALNNLAEGRDRIPGAKAGENGFLRELFETSDYLYESVNNIREGLLSLLDLHLNVVSFEMNRVMRVLAVVSVLGLIPAVIGGLFGMNLADNPWPFTLPQVTFAVVSGMVTCLYFFLVKGWLR